MADERLIVALDFHTMEDVKSLVTVLGDSVSYYKVGMELFYSVGGQVDYGEVDARPVPTHENLRRNVGVRGVGVFLRRHGHPEVTRDEVANVHRSSRP